MRKRISTKGYSHPPYTQETQLFDIIQKEMDSQNLALFNNTIMPIQFIPQPPKHNHPTSTNN